MGELYVSYRKRFVLSLPGPRMFVPQKKDGSNDPVNQRLLNVLRKAWRKNLE